MGIFKFWKKRKYKKLSLNEKISKLRDYLQKEISSFQNFKQLQVKKRDFLAEIKNIWNEQVKEAEKIVKIDIPALISEQLEFVEVIIKCAYDEDSVLEYLTEIEGENKEIVERNGNLIKLKKNLKKQLKFFNKNGPWQAINKNEKLVRDLNEEQSLTQEIEIVMGKIMAEIEEILRIELIQQARKTGLSRREFLRNAASAGLSLGILGTSRPISAQYSPQVHLLVNTAGRMDKPLAKLKPVLESFLRIGQVKAYRTAGVRARELTIQYLLDYGLDAEPGASEHVLDLFENFKPHDKKNWIYITHSDKLGYYVELEFFKREFDEWFSKYFKKEGISISSLIIRGEDTEVLKELPKYYDIPHLQYVAKETKGIYKITAPDSDSIKQNLGDIIRAVRS